jgi:hypothetical protein
VIVTAAAAALAACAQLNLAIGDEQSIKADSLAVMEEAMTFFFRVALQEKRRKNYAPFSAILFSSRNLGACLFPA